MIIICGMISYVKFNRLAYYTVDTVYVILTERCGKSVTRKTFIIKCSSSGAAEHSGEIFLSVILCVPEDRNYTCGMTGGGNEAERHVADCESVTVVNKNVRFKIKIFCVLRLGS